ncbi:MAG: AAA family ATPase [Archangiaceae bacterium]|nr:AAA family ATPase [Archangiaceae bacterium]
MGLELFDWYGGGSYDTEPWPPEIDVSRQPAEGTQRWADRTTGEAVRALNLARKKRGALVLGRFDPPHLGHAFLIRAARETTETKVVVAVFSRPGDFIEGSARVSALKTLVAHRATEVLEVKVDETFPTGSPDPERWVSWFKASGLDAKVGALVSSDPNAEAFAKAAGLELILVDPARQSFPISSTAIRADPWATWDALLPDLHPRFARLVGLIGPEGGGKSTVARALGAHFKTSVGAEYLERLAGGLSRAMQPADVSGDAFSGQRQTNGQVRLSARRFGIVDSDLANLKLWFERLFPQEKPFELKADQWCHHYLLFDDHPWTGAPAKDQPEARRRMVHDAIQMLEANGKSYVLIDGPREGRLKKSIDAIEAWVKTKPWLRP